MKRAVALSLIALGVLASPAAAANLELTPASTGNFPARGYLLTLPTQVVLSPGQVSVTENGASVDGLSVRSVNTVGAKHFATVLVIDGSTFMRGSTIQAAMAAARSFAQQRDPQLPLGVVTFAKDANTALGLTTNPEAIEHALASPPPLSSGSHPYTAVALALQMLARAHVIAGSVLLLSDGAETGHNSLKAAEVEHRRVIRTAAAQNVHVYAIGLHDQAFNATVLQHLAAATGASYTAIGASGVKAVLQRLGTALSDQYLLQYRSLAPAGSKVKVVVRVAGQPGAGTYTYRAPDIPATETSGVSRRDTSFWNSTGAALLICLFAAALIGLATFAVLRPRRNVRERVSRFVSRAPVAKPKSWTAALVEHAFADDDTGLLARPRLAKFSEELEISRLGLSARDVFALTAIGTIVLGWLLVSATGSAIAALLALSVPIAVRGVIRLKVARERRAFDEQLPGNLQVVASAMRAGHTFVGALSVVAQDAAEPSRREARRVLADEQLGVPLVVTLNTVTARMQSRDFQHVALVAALQRETGGNTAEVIDTVADTIRERIDLRRLVRTLSAEGRLTATIVAALPVLLLIFISLADPHYAHPLFHTTTGIIALMVAAMLIGSGFWVMRRVVKIEV